MPGAVYQETYSIETVRTILRTDRVYKMLYQGTPHILHLEFQIRAEKDMAARLLEYHAYFYHKYGLPVISIIIYPFRTTIAISPLEETSNGNIILSFTFRNFPLWLLSAEEYLEDHVIAMYALLPAMSGANARLLDQAIEEMVKYYQNDEITLAWMGIILRRTDCVSEEDKRMIQERLSMYDDLMENDPEMQRLRAKYKKEGLAEGKIEGKIEGKAEALQANILIFIKARFPALTKQTRQRVSLMGNIDELQDLFEQLVSISDEAEARELLTTSTI